jgi:hypothetical protein
MIRDFLHFKVGHISLKFSLSFTYLMLPYLGYSEEPKIKYLPIKMGTFTEYGKIEKGSQVEAYGSNEVVTKQNMSRVAAWIEQDVMVNDRLFISAGISGLFWYSLPETQGLPHTRLLKFATGLQAASAQYSMGEVEHPYLKLQMGMFPYKYNPDANNLGEYLYRSGTYPGYLWTGGWTLLKTAAYSANGIRAEFSLLQDQLKVDANLFIERDIEPNFDISPSLMATYTNGFFEIGSGAVFSHLLPANSEKVTPETRENAYYHDSKRNQDLPLPQEEWTKPGNPYYGVGDSRNSILIVDPSNSLYHKQLDTTNPDSPRYVSLEENGVPKNQLKYYTFKGIKVMARASIDPLRLFNLDFMEEGAGKIYTEVTLLGVKDYPFYYEKKSERMPVMFGVNIPTFKILDRLSFELEHYKSPFANSIKTEFGKVYPIWDLPIDAKRDIPTADPIKFQDSSMQVKGREWFWSVYAQKNIVPGFSVVGQIAHDHTRALNYMANATYQPFIQAPEDWYWAIRVEFSI